MLGIRRRGESSLPSPQPVPPATLTIDSLVERAQSGDAGAFEDIVRRLAGPVRSYASRMMRDPHLGEDAAQETFFRVWKGLSRHERREGRFTAWTFRVARNTCVELLRREGRAPIPVEQVDPGATDPYAQIDLRLVIQEAIEGLREPYRTTIALREAGLDHPAMADVLGCPLATVRSRLHRGTKQLADVLQPALATDA